jgi:hypothetical protein
MDGSVMMSIYQMHIIILYLFSGTTSQLLCFEHNLSLPSLPMFKIVRATSPLPPHVHGA